MKLGTIISLFILLMLTMPVSAEILNVPDDFDTIQDAIESSEDNDTVLVAEGTYRENLDFQGRRIALASWFIFEEDTSLIEETIIDGNRNDPVITLMNDEPVGTEIIGLTIRNGAGRWLQYDEQNWFTTGAGVFCINSSPTFRHCRITDNVLERTIPYAAAGVYAVGDSGSVRFFDCEISNNRSIESFTGGFYSRNLDVELINCRINRNSICAAWISNTEERSIILRNCSFTGNFAGCFLVSGPANVIVEDSDFWENGHVCLEFDGDVRSHVTGCNFINNDGSGYHGAIVESIFENCRFDNNRWLNDGGAMRITQFSGSIIRNCLFRDNTAPSGGAIGLLQIGDLTLENCIFTDNSATGLGAAVYCYTGSQNHGHLDMINCTIHGNDAEEDCGTVVLSENFTVNMKNCILYNNGEHQIRLQSQNLTPEIVIDYSLIEGGRNDILLNGQGVVNWLEGNIDVDPLFVDPENEDFNLNADSPCIDSGDPESPVDPDSTRADMGAFPFHHRDIEINPDELVFADVQTRTVDSLALTIRNVGMAPLMIDSQILSPEDSPFAVGLGGGEVEIAPESEHLTWILFTPEQDGNYNARAIIHSNDPDEETLEIPITGNALGVEPDTPSLPFEFAITSVYPNPFNQSAIIHYTVPQSERVALRLVDLTGRRINLLVDAFHSTGSYSLVFKARDIAAGVYILRLDGTNTSRAQKLLLIR